MSKGKSRKSLLPITLAISTILLIGWGVWYVRNIKAPLGPNMVPHGTSQATLDRYKAGGWIPLEEPDSRFVPGSIFKATPGHQPEWRSSLESCGVPKEVLTSVTNNTGSFQYTGDATYGAQAILNVPGITAGPQFNIVREVTFRQSDTGASTFDTIKALDWMTNNKSSFKPVCKQYLSEPYTFVAQDSYRVGGGTYTLLNSTNGKIDLQKPKTQVLRVSADAAATVSQDSSLTLTVPVYTAVREAIYADDFLKEVNFPTRGTLKKADTDILHNLPQ